VRGTPQPAPDHLRLSNPSSKAECSAQEAYMDSDGRGAVCRRGAVPAVTLNGGPFHSGLVNNFYIYPKGHDVSVPGEHPRDRGDDGGAWPSRCFEQGLAQMKRPSDIRAWIEQQLFRP
jgi:malate dehydrogenase (oxaloacetate-decarboxylating)(NADP+)